MPIVIRHAYSSSGAPLAGLTPTWHSYIDAETGADLPQPTIAPIGGGSYGADVADGACGTIDFGVTALHRYATVESRTVFTFAAFSASTGAPLTGLGSTPSFSLYTDAAGVAGVAPAVSELARGWYRCATSTTAANALLDLTAAAEPRYLAVDTDDTDGVVETDPPEITNVRPQAGTTLTSTQAIGFDVTDAGGLRRVILHARFAGRSVVEVVHNGTSFEPLYIASSRTAVSGGYRFSLTRTGGWPSAPTFKPYAIDLAGNESF